MSRCGLRLWLRPGAGALRLRSGRFSLSPRGVSDTTTRLRSECLCVLGDVCAIRRVKRERPAVLGPREESLQPLRAAHVRRKVSYARTGAHLLKTHGKFCATPLRHVVPLCRRSHECPRSFQRPLPARSGCHESFYDRKFLNARSADHVENCLLAASCCSSSVSCALSSLRPSMFSSDGISAFASAAVSGHRLPS